MTLLVASCFWVLAATAVATVPVRLQLLPGAPLLLAAPTPMILPGQDVGLRAGIIAGLALVSMFRKPLRCFMGRVMGLRVGVLK